MALLHQGFTIFVSQEYDALFVIRLKANATLKKYSQDILNEFEDVYSMDYTKHHVMYDDFTYQAKSWKKPLRVICRVERAPGELLPRATFIVITLEAEPKLVVRAYNKRGNMENFIKEAKIDFSMELVSHSSFIANAIKCFIKALAYNIVNIMKRTVLPKEHQSCRLMSIRVVFIKIAYRIVTSTRRTTFKLCSNYPWRNQFQKIMNNINKLCFA